MLAIKRYGIWRVGLLVAVVAMATRLEGYDVRFSPGGIPNPYLNPIKDSFVGRLDDFFNGILLCYLCIHKKPRFMKNGGGFPLLLCGFLVCLLAMVGWDNVALRQLPQWFSPFLHVLVNVAAFCIIYSLYHLRGRFRRIVFENYPVQLAGVMCYSLYVWHGITNFLLIGHASYTVKSALLLCISLSAMTVLSYRFIEFGHVKDWRSLFLLSKKPEDDPAQ